MGRTKLLDQRAKRRREYMQKYNRKRNASPGGKEYTRKYNFKYHALPESKVRQRNAHLKHAYGITLETYQLILLTQGGRCAICGIPKPGGKGTFHVDHDHKTNKIRGLLCHYCNAMLAYSRDNPETLRAGARYILSFWKGDS